MGKDIHMYLVSKTKGLIKDNLYEGRNSEWFDNLSGRGFNNAYEYLIPDYYYLPDWVPEGIRKKEKDYSGFDTRCIKFTDFMLFVDKYRPHIDAGWFTKYDCWRIDNYNWFPHDEGVCHYIDAEDAATGLYEFREVVNKFEPSFVIYGELMNLTYNLSSEEIDDYYLVWFFDW